MTGNRPSRRLWSHGQLVDVFEGGYLRYDFLSLYFQEVYTVSADVIVFE